MEEKNDQLGTCFLTYGLVVIGFTINTTANLDLPVMFATRIPEALFTVMEFWIHSMFKIRTFFVPLVTADL